MSLDVLESEHKDDQGGGTLPVRGKGVCITATPTGLDENTKAFSIYYKTN